MPDGPITRYRGMIAAGELRPDPAQAVAVEKLQLLHMRLRDYDPQKGKRVARGWFGFGKGAPHKQIQLTGLYLYGGVGRGKSMLMDLFYDRAPVRPKRRVHFHAFMAEIHVGVHIARESNVDDPIRVVAEEVAEGATLLCFDEMQVTDITDAMILGRLFEALFNRGVVVVSTSNRPPDDLYKDGLNRQLFLPFIDLLKTRMVVWELSSPKDYRQDRLAGAPSYFTPVSSTARRQMDAIWADLTGGQDAPLDLVIKGRTVTIPRFHNAVGRATFFDLCAQPLGPADYLAVAEACRVLIIDDIPCLSRNNFNAAKRFVTLIDALYEARVRLICSAADTPEMLYLEGEGSFEFERTASRLREMQSAGWGRQG